MYICIYTYIYICISREEREGWFACWRRGVMYSTQTHLDLDPLSLSPYIYTYLSISISKYLAICIYM